MKKDVKRDAKGLMLLADALSIAADYIDNDRFVYFYDELECVGAVGWLEQEAACLRRKAEKLRGKK